MSALCWLSFQRDPKKRSYCEHFASITTGGQEGFFARHRDAASSFDRRV
jgi:hypothetical protein